MIENRHKGWSILEQSQLYPHQVEVWGEKCPGVASGHFKKADETDFAVVVVRELNGTKQAKLLLLEKSGPTFRLLILREEAEVPSYPVVHKEPPGQYRHFYDKKITINSTNDVIVYEHLEATATLFHFLNGRYQELLISD